MIILRYSILLFGDAQGPGVEQPERRLDRRARTGGGVVRRDAGPRFEGGLYGRL